MKKKKTYTKPDVSIVRLDREFADTTVGMATSRSASEETDVLSRKDNTLFDIEWDDEEE